MQTFSIDEFNNKKKEAFTSFFNSNWNGFYYYAYKYFSDKETAEDVVAECFVKLWRSKEVFQSISDIKKFMFTIVKNRSLDEIRRNKKFKNNQVDDLEILDETEISIIELKQSVIEQILIEIENLTPALKKVFKLSYFENIPEKEIAKMLKMKVRSVYNAKHRALEILRSKFPKLPF